MEKYKIVRLEYKTGKSDLVGGFFIKTKDKYIPIFISEGMLCMENVEIILEEDFEWLA